MKGRYVWLLLAFLLPAWAAASGVRASLDRSKVQLGETVTLNLTVDGSDSMGMPDLDPLRRDFDVLGTSSSSSISIVNGKQSAQFTIGIALRPKHVGQLTVPSLAVAGGHTAPLLLDVTPPDPNAAANSGKDVFIEAGVEPDHGYVGQQMVYTLRLYHDVDLSGSLQEPQLPGVDVRRLGSDINYDVERGGRTYHVLERRYALVPSHAGNLVVPSMQFQGSTGDSSDPFGPGSFFGQSGLFGGGRQVSAASPAVTLHVAAPPSGWGGDAWLPARQLSLSLDGLPADSKLHVGQALNLHMVVQASGLPAESLPEPSLPTLSGATVYPDRPVDTTSDDGKWLEGKRERAFAIVPQQAGTLTIPATTLKWFNVQSGQTETASIPATTLTVLPASGTTAAPAAATSAALPAATGPGMQASSRTTVTPVAPAAGTVPAWWRWVAIASLALLLLGIVAWWLLRRRASASVPKPARVAPTIGPSTDRAMRKRFLDAARGDDVATQARHLLAWGRAERPGLQNLGELAAALASDPQRTAIAWLQRRQYADAATGARSPDLRAAFEHGFVWRDERPQDDRSPLPPLYPFDLGPR